MKLLFPSAALGLPLHPSPPAPPPGRRQPHPHIKRLRGLWKQVQGPHPDRPGIYKLSTIFFTFPVFLFVNAALLGVAWIYLAVILGGISIAFLSFYQLIKLTWATGAEP